MIDFETRLGTMLDDVAASVHPHSDPDSIFTQNVTVVPAKVHHFRPRYLAVAAASVVFVGTSAFAMEKINNDPPAKIVPAASPVTEPTFAPTTTSVEELPAPTIAPTTGTTLPSESPSRPSKETGVVAPVVSEPTVPPTEPTVPPTEPTVPPVSIEFTAKLGADGRANNPMTQGFYGKANPGSLIHLASPYGEADTTADADGKWAATLTMREVPPGTKVGVRITSSTSDRVREFSLLRPGAEPTPTTAAPAVIEFTANLGANGSANTPMTQGFFGTAQPGSAIRVGSDWGVAETTATAGGYWETTLSMGDVPAGTTIAVRITSNTSTRVREFTLQRPGTPPPVTVDFTAHAGWATTDATPPFDEYSGTSTAGAVITLTSPYGNGQAVSNADGHWSARIEFPAAPIGETFNVHVTSTKGSAVFDFPLTHVSPG
jgi:hypothetical protein